MWFYVCLCSVYVPTGLPMHYLNYMTTHSIVKFTLKQLFNPPNTQKIIIIIILFKSHTFQLLVG